jgi:hypothetical protein
VPVALASFLNGLGSDEIIAAVGSYPSGQVGSFVKDEVNWSQVKSNLDSFLE